MIVRVWAGSRRWAGAVALASLVALLASACGLSGPATTSGGASSTGSGRLTNAAGIKVAANAWVGHLVSYVAEDPTTIGKVETGFALQADHGVLAFNQSRGAPENQYQPTGNVDWVAIPAQTPTLSELARIETNFKPIPGSTQPAESEDALVLLQRKSVQSGWTISNYANMTAPSEPLLNQVRTIGKPLSSRAAARLPIPAQGLPSAYASYLGGGESSKFAPGPLTDQVRDQFESGKAAWASLGVSYTYQYSHGSVQGVYTVKGGDSLVDFGFVYNGVYQANGTTCLRQSSHAPLPTSVPDGNYQSVTMQYLTSGIAIEDPRTGSTSMVATWSFPPVKATTTPTTAPTCL